MGHGGPQGGAGGVGNLDDPDVPAECQFCLKSHKNYKAMRAHQRKYHRAELGLPEVGEGPAGKECQLPF